MTRMKRPENWSGGRCLGSVAMPARAAAASDAAYFSSPSAINHRTASGLDGLDSGLINPCATATRTCPR